MAFTEILSSWLVGKCADSAFSKVSNKLKEEVFTPSENEIVEEIRNLFFQKYNKETFYENLDRYITDNECIQLSVKFASSVKPQEQRLHSQFVDYHTRKFIEEYPSQTCFKHEIKNAFDIINSTAILRVNLSSDPEIRKVQSTVIRQSEGLKDTFNVSQHSIEKKINQIPTQVVELLQEVIPCQDEELQPFFDQIENIKESTQDKGKYSDAIQAYYDCYREISLKFKYKNSNTLNELNSSILCRISVCYANIGNFSYAKNTLQAAINLCLNKVVRDTYAAIALQTRSIDMYNQSILYMETNLKDDPQDIVSFLFVQIFTVLIDETKFDNVIEQLELKKSSLNEDFQFAKYFEFKALIERFCNKHEQAIEDFQHALKFGYDESIAKLNIASAYYSIAVEKSDSSDIMRRKIKWKELLTCHDMLVQLLGALPDTDLKQLFLPELLKIYLSSCVLLHKQNIIYRREDVVTLIWTLDYDSIKSFILTIPDTDVIQQRHYLKHLNESDSEVWRIHQKISHNNYAEAEEIAYSGLQRNIFSHPALIYDMLLQIALCQCDADKYEKYRDEMIDNGFMTPSYRTMEAFFKELTEQPEEAKKQIDMVVSTCTDFGDLENALRFYWRNNFKNEALDTIKLILKYKRDGIVCIINPDEFYWSIFKFLLENDFKCCCDIVESVGTNDLSEKTLLQMQLDVAIRKNDFYSMTLCNKKLYRLTQSAQYLINAASSELQMGNCESSENILKELDYSSLNQDQRWSYNLIYSKIELLRNCYEKAFEHAARAHQDNLDRPRHPSHSYYLSVATRCGQAEKGLAETLSFKKENPIAVDYIREINSLTIDDAGNQALSQEFKDFLATLKEDTNKWRQSYRDGILGLYQLTGMQKGDHYGGDYVNLLSQIFSTEDGKAQIFSGNIDILNQEADILRKATTITVDALSLIMMAYLDLLSLLDQYEVVYLGYSTFSFIQELMISTIGSTKVYQTIYEWISRSSNCVKCPDGPILFDETLKEFFPIHLLASINVSIEKNSPLLYADTVESMLLRTKEAGIQIDLVSINSLVEAIKDKSYAQVLRLELMKSVTFVNFNAKDILYQIERSGKVDPQELSVFFSYTSDADIASFVTVYGEALIQLKEKNSELAEAFALELITNATKIRKKATYYKMTFEKAWKGEVDISLPHVKKHIKKYVSIIEYSSALCECIRQLFSDNNKICESVKLVTQND